MCGNTKIALYLEQRKRNSPILHHKRRFFLTIQIKQLKINRHTIIHLKLTKHKINT